MSWDYRILAKKSFMDVFFELHEVYYEDGKPTSCTMNPVTIDGEKLSDISECLDLMKMALNKPVLWYHDLSEYK